MANGIIITIGRQFCSGGSEVAAALAQKLALPYYDRQLMEKAAQEKGYSTDFVEELEEKPVSSFMYSLAMHTYANGGAKEMLPPGVQIGQVQTEMIEEAALKGSCVIVGRCADFILRKDPRLFSVFLCAPMDFRVRRAMEKYGISENEALRLLVKTDRKRAAYYNDNTTRKWGARETYHLTLDVGKLGIQTTVHLLENAALELMQK